MKESLSVQAVVLAAGKSTRFAMGSSKLLFPLCGKPMVLHPLQVLQELTIPTVVVTGYQKELLTECITQQHYNSPVIFIEQKEQRGTGHAVQCTKSMLQEHDILIVNGDMPLITAELLKQLIDAHRAYNATISFVVAPCDEFPNGYGKVIRDIENKVRIVEARDFHGSACDGRLINAGIYIIKRAFLLEQIEKLALHENSQEWYITDMVDAASSQDYHVQTLEADFDLIRGVNTVHELTIAEKILRARIIHEHMRKGVYFENPDTVIIEHGVSIGSGTKIGSGVHLAGTTTIGRLCTIGSYSSIKNSMLEDSITILPHCVIDNSEIHDHASIGPFAHLRNVHSIHEKVTIGNFVEVSSSTIGKGSKAKHLSYLGNADIGEQVNIGAGTITCNYDGKRKHITCIKDRAKIGSINALVAPVTIGPDAMTAAGSVITDNVPPHALAIARARQVNKEHYAQRLIDQPQQFIAAVKEK